VHQGDAGVAAQQEGGALFAIALFQVGKDGFQDGFKGAAGAAGHQGGKQLTIRLQAAEQVIEPL
jgi:hypothetical protein